MAGAWTQFARTGNPNGPGLPEWPTYRAPEYRILDYGDVIAVGSNAGRPEVEFFRPIVETMRTREAQAE